MSIVIPSQSISGLAPIAPQPAEAPAEGGFNDLLNNVDQILKRADEMAAGYAQGKVGLTDAVLASEKADTTFQMTMALRNRAVAAYQEILNLQV